MYVKALLNLYHKLSVLYLFDYSGVLARLNYLKDDVGSSTIYIMSIYESNDDDHLAVVDHTIIDFVYGNMEDFERLLRDLRKMKSMNKKHVYILYVLFG